MRYGRHSRSRHLDRLGDQISVPIEPDGGGYIGRECPVCEGYFKITVGTGITDGNPPCHCLYCGHTADHDQFFTHDQIEYAESVVVNKVTAAAIEDLKSMEFNIKPRGAFGIGMSMKVEGRPEPVRHYREKRLETDVVCDQCTLRYTIYGVFAFCPDCATHNSRQILNKNLELVDELLAMASDDDAELSEHRIGDALKSAVSAFDGFGRELCTVNAAKASDSSKAGKLSFQNLSGARRNVQDLFGFDFAAAIESTEWDFACRCFKKRNLLAHKMGVVDSAYLQATNDPHAVQGRKVRIGSDEVEQLIKIIRQLGESLDSNLASLGTS